MRLALSTVMVCLYLLVWAVQPAVSQAIVSNAQDVDAAGASQSDAAEKHAKRTACLKDAKSKKLVGAQRTAYVKDCMAVNSPLNSASTASP
jgi:hypothetical protein